MSNNSDPDLPHELEDVAARLRAERPRLTGLELDEMRQRVRARSTGSLPTTRRQMIMKSRMVVTMMLVLGMVFSTAGAGLAVSGLTGQDNAGNVVYKQDQNLQGTLGEVQTVQPSKTDDEPTADPAPRAQAQAPQQVAATESGDELPFTGFTAIPVLLGGIALLGGGVALRRKTDQ